MSKRACRMISYPTDRGHCERCLQAQRGRQMQNVHRQSGQSAQPAAKPAD